MMKNCSYKCGVLCDVTTETATVYPSPLYSINVPYKKTGNTGAQRSELRRKSNAALMKR